MATIKNSGDIALQATTPRLNVLPANFVLVTAFTNTITTTAIGTFPSSITITATLNGELRGTVTWSSGGKGAVLGNTLTLQANEIPAGDSLTVTASLDYLGNTYTSSYVVSHIAETVTSSLSKYVSAIPVTYDGTGGDYAQVTSTMTVAIGGVDNTAGWSYSWSVPVGVTATGQSTNTITISAMTVDTADLVCTATRANYPTQTQTYKVNRVRAGNPGDPGDPGPPGANGARTAILDMYLWSSTVPNQFPQGTSTFTWASNTFTLPATPNGWSLTPGTGAQGQSLYLTRQIYTDNLTTETSTVTWSQTSSVVIGQLGTNGTRTAFLEVYQWAATQPTTFPQGTSTYTWATGSFTLPATPNSWTLTPGSYSPGDTLWGCQVTYSDIGTSATTDITWNTTTAYAVGAAGTQGPAGANGITVVLSNEVHVFPAATNGNIATAGYVGSGTDIRVYDGATELTYDGTGIANGTWKVVVTTQTNIIAGAISDQGTFARVAQHSGVADGIDTSSILYTITGKNSLGTAFTITKTQTFSKAKTGQPAVVYEITVTSPVISKDSPSVLVDGTHTTVTIGDKKYEGSTVSTNIGFITVQNAAGTYQTNLGTATTAVATSTTRTLAPATNADTSFYTIKLYNQATISGATLLDTLVIPVVFKGDTGSTGSTGVSNYRAYRAGSPTTAPDVTPNPTSNGVPPTDWSLTPVTLTTGQAQWQIDGTTPAGGTETTWTAPYLSYFKVGSLSAISADLGTITAGDITGTKIRTATTGARIAINDTGYSNKIAVWGINDSTSPGLYIGSSDGSNNYSVIRAFTGNISTGPAILGRNTEVSVGISGQNTATGSSYSSTAVGTQGSSTIGPGIWGTSSGAGIGVLATTTGSGFALRASSSIDNVAALIENTAVSTSTNPSAHGLRVRSNNAGISSLVAVARISGGWNFYAETISGTGSSTFPTGAYGPFTGGHDALLLKTTVAEPGDILADVSIINKLQVSDTISEVNLATSTSKSVIGVFVNRSSLSNDWIPNGLIKETIEVYSEENPTEVISVIKVPIDNFDSLKNTHDYITTNSLGEGQINVCGLNGNIEAGDLIVASAIPGKGQRQDDDIVRSKTVAKARESAVFDEPTQVKQIACIYLCG